MQVTLSKHYVEEECCSCGVVFFVTKQLLDQFRKTKQRFFCPNGHGQAYTKGTADILEEELQMSKARILSLETDLRIALTPKKRGRKKAGL